VTTDASRLSLPVLVGQAVLARLLCTLAGAAVTLKVASVLASKPVRGGVSPVCGHSQFAIAVGEGALKRRAHVP
jgi:hypothetical protein